MLRSWKHGPSRFGTRRPCSVSRSFALSLNGGCGVGKGCHEKHAGANLTPVPPLHRTRRAVAPSQRVERRPGGEVALARCFSFRVFRVFRGRTLRFLVAAWSRCVSSRLCGRYRFFLGFSSAALRLDGFVFVHLLRRLRL